MRIVYPTWSVEVSDEWSVTEHPECLTLELSDKAALQGSSATKKGGVVTEQDLFFVEGRDGWGEHQRCAFGDFEGIVYEYQDDGLTWIRWFLRNASTLLFFTYNGTREATSQERRTVQAALRTLKAHAPYDA